MKQNQSSQKSSSNLFHFLFRKKKKSTLKAIINVTLIINLSNHKNQRHKWRAKFVSKKFISIKSLSSSPLDSNANCCASEIEWASKKSFKFRTVCKFSSHSRTLLGITKKSNKLRTKKNFFPLPLRSILAFRSPRNYFNWNIAVVSSSRKKLLLSLLILLRGRWRESCKIQIFTKICSAL